ncbi:MAG: methionine synthase [Planctomycetes bacterium]|nr:methionine synthase [Planctomycetota bacterium]
MQSKLLDTLKERVLVFDGAMGTQCHARDLPLSDYRDLENCIEVLTQTRPDVIGDIHRGFLAVGCDAIETNTFGATKLLLDEFGLESETRRINCQAAEIARSAAESFDTPAKPRFVIGSIGPGTKLPTLRHTDWDTLVDSYTEQCRGLMDGGVDAFLIETCQDILQSKTAIVSAEQAMAECGRTVPIMVTVTIETTGTMLVGTEIGAAVAALEAYPSVKVIGLNCATGPQEMSEHIRYLSSHCDRMLLVQPNAGLPQLVEGQLYYPLTPAELARWLVEFIDQDGLNAVGGCCGTTPEHLAAVVDAVGTRSPKRRRVTHEPSVSSIYQSVTLRQESDILSIGERTNANGSKKFREMLAAEDYDGIVKLAKEQVSKGSHALDVCAAYVGRDERRDMHEVIQRLSTEITVPLVIDSTEVDVLDDALKLLGGKSIINSINLEDGEERLDTVCKLARRYGAALVALTIDEEGMAKTADQKVVVAKRIYDLVVNRHGIAPEDLIFDCLTFTICTGNADDRRLGMETLEGMRRVKEELPGVHTVLGLSNISFGLKPPLRRVLNSVFLHYAREHGLDAAILHAGGIVPLFKIDDEQRTTAEDLIFDRRREGYEPLERYMELFVDHSDVESKTETKPTTVEERLKQAIIDGDRTQLEADLTEAMGTYRPLDIVNELLLDGMKTVGDLFGAGQMQLPFVLKSAEAMKSAVAFLEPYMDKSEQSDRGSIVLATVRGDVHDIGKNLVDIILTNNGYTVHNLGIKQPIASIIEAYEKTGADVIGMSGLLVKSTVVMRENLAVLNERGLTPAVMLGGAALTRKYVEQDLVPEYRGPLFYAKDAFDGLTLMKQIVAGEADTPGVSVKSATRAQVVTPAAAVASGGPPDEPDPPAPSIDRIEAPVPTPARSDIARDVPIPEPPFWGARVVERLDISAVLGFLNENMLFQVQWQYKKAGRSRAQYNRYVNDEVRPIYRKLVQRCRAEKLLQPQTIYGYWPAQSDGDELIVFDVDDRSRELVRFEFPRRRKAPYWCISDFFRPVSSGEMDVVAFSLVTMGRRVSEVAHEWFQADRYQDYLHLHGLGVESAEALAEFIHKQIRVELGIADADAREIQRLFQQRYQGSRYSFGYPACPRLEDQLKLWPLLNPERIGVTISEEFQLEPEQSTTALICHHPEAKYFTVGPA